MRATERAPRHTTRWFAALNWLVQGFAIDPRSLALFRIALAAMVLVDLAERLPDLSVHYTDAGVLPRAARVVMEHNGSSAAGTWAWSLHMATGTAVGEAVLFGLAACCALSMLVGYHTRRATVLTWLLTVSLYYRNPMLEDAGDLVLHTVLFWSMFLPLNARLSFDRRLRSQAPPAARPILSPTGAALLLQICMIYWSTAAEKQSPVWREEHTALYYTLSLDAFATPFGHRLLAFPGLLRWLTAGVYWLEWLGPVVAVLPFGRGYLRVPVVMAFWAFHLGSALTLRLGAFPWISMAIWTVFLPAVFWDKLRRHSSSGRVTSHEVGRGLENPPVRPFHRAARALREVAVSMLLLYVAVWNFNQVSGRLEGRLPAGWKIPAYVLALEQTWRMFAPFPLTEDGWYEMRGVLADGSVVNLWDHDRPPPRRKPQNVAETYRHRRWRKYLVELRARWAWFIPEFAQWLRHRWNERLSDADTDRWVKRVEIVYHIENTLSPDRTSNLIVPEIVFEGEFPDPFGFVPATTGLAPVGR